MMILKFLKTVLPWKDDGDNKISCKFKGNTIWEVSLNENNKESNYDCYCVTLKLSSINLEIKDYIFFLEYEDDPTEILLYDNKYDEENIFNYILSVAMNKIKPSEFHDNENLSEELSFAAGVPKFGATVFLKQLCGQ